MRRVFFYEELQRIVRMAAIVDPRRTRKKICGSSDMPAARAATADAIADPVKNRRPPKIYYLHYPAVGALAEWPSHLARCRAMGFDFVAIPPPFEPDASGNVFDSRDFRQPNSALGLAPGKDAVQAIAALCAEHGLRLILDVAVRAAPSVPMEDPPDPRLLASASADEAAAPRDGEQSGEWIERLRGWVRSGAAGFRCLHLARQAPEFWRDLIETVPDALFLGWILDPPRETASRYAALGFDYVFGRADDIGALCGWDWARPRVPVIAAPEMPFGPRLCHDGGATRSRYSRALGLAGAGDGILIPVGFEFAASRALDPVYSAPADLAAAMADAPFDLSAEIAAANARLDRATGSPLGGVWRPLARQGAVAAALRLDAADPRRAATGLMLLVNDDDAAAHDAAISLAPLPSGAGAAFEAVAPLDGESMAEGKLAPGEVRILRVVRSPGVAPAPGDSRDAARRAAAAPRIAIEALSPCVDGGRFAAKRIVGEPVEVEADIFADGHELLAASLLWRAEAERDWNAMPMRLHENDRWRGGFLPRHLGRYYYVVEAWIDRWGSLCADIAKKQAAGIDVALDVADAFLIIADAEKQAQGEVRGTLRALRTALALRDAAARIALLLADETGALMHAVLGRGFLTRSEPEMPVEIDRPQAGFASWYELFPRSAGSDGARHGTFGDVIGRLPAIARMGFDVLYFPPIHPIGTTNRKGRNNALVAMADDPGSPYAIGGAAGGHTAIDPALGTLADFRRLRDAAYAQGLEIALDFAVQCSPDHPWLAEHPGWFRHRADGSIRYAENPPKKYEDIVNPDFYAPDAIPDLWLALRDVVLFWAGEGIRIFRVDNPHTKPLPFWEWLIADTRARYPELIFLAEAFTRPKPMYHLAKLGFSQSYTYFTWRNTKWELTAYLRELADGPPRDFFRPNFFVNTPDINPYFLQQSGRAGFLIRAALAATLSGAWGVYSGFELCEAAALPGREEYLDSEKYQLRARDYDAPGNIAAEIAALNRLRRDHEALQTHRGVTFYNAFNDNILVYGKSARRRGETVREMIFVAVNLDPHRAQEAAYELPLWEFGLPDTGRLAVEDLWRGHRFVLQGKMQTLRLDPAELPFAIWRLGMEAR